MVSLIWRPSDGGSIRRLDLRNDPERGPIRVKEADITVITGNGTFKIEFRCQKTILSFASAQLDALIDKTSNDILLLPNVNSDAWELFYKSIDPRQIGSNDENVKLPPLKKAKLLAPLFRKFDMMNYFDKCEDIFKEFIRDEEQEHYFGDYDPDINEVVTLLRLSVMCDLPMTKKAAENFISMLFETQHKPDNVLNQHWYRHSD